MMTKLLLHSGCLGSILVFMNVPVPGAPCLGADVAATGLIEGTVTYQADPARPWRYSRFYVKGSGARTLSEAVVALHGSELRKFAPEHKPATAVVDQRDFQFLPETSAIRAGDSVKFLNSDGPTHNVRSSHAVANFNENMPAEGEYVHLFKKPTGALDPIVVGCVYHGNMRAWIYVFDHPYFQLTQAAGHFRIENVPAGNFRLDIVHPAGQLRWSQRVEIKPGDVLKLNVALSPDNKVQ